MPNTSTTNGNLLLLSDPSAGESPAINLGVSRVHGDPSAAPLARVALFGDGVDGSRGVVALSTAGTPTGPLEERFRVHSNGHVGIGTSAPAARLQVSGGAIMPTTGNTEQAGILFPKDPGGGGGDAAWIRYYARAGEATTLELGVSDNADDDIALMPSGHVGIGTTQPTSKLDTHGDVALFSRHALRGTDNWLRLNQESAFSAGTHTPGLFAPGSLNVGGVGNWSNPGPGNATIAGDLAIGGKHALRANKGPWLRLNDDGAFTSGVHTPGLFAPGSLNVGGVNGWLNPGRGNACVAGEISMDGSFLRVRGGGGELCYMGGDAAGNDVQIGSERADITRIAAWNTQTQWMYISARGFNQASDQRHKQQIAPLSQSLETVRRLRGVSFQWKSEQPAVATARQLGMIAQEVQAVAPEAVSDDGRGTLAISYSAITALLVEAVKEQALRLEKLEAELNALKSAAVDNTR